MSTESPNQRKKFDELMTHVEGFINAGTTKEFIEFLTREYEELRAQWIHAENECVRLQQHVTKYNEDNTRQDRKIQEIRRHLEGKMETANRLGLEKERLELKNNSAKSLVTSYLADTNVSGETKDRLVNILAVLETGEIGNRRNITMARSPAGGLDTISEGASTDLSITHSEDDLDVSYTRTRRRGKRPSLERSLGNAKRGRHSSGNQHKAEANGRDQVIARTVVSVDRDGHGPIHAVTSLETVPAKGERERRVSIKREKETKFLYIPSAPPQLASESEQSDAAPWVDRRHESPVIRTDMTSDGITNSPRFGHTLSSAGNMALRPHAFCQKTVLKPETCEPCGKRIKFSKYALKCRDCKATCHPECKNNVPLPCVATGTPGNKNQMGTIADYVPTTHPMVPGLIQHCVNEIETRGMDIVGLYRVPGQEKEVRELKDRFLRGKGVPNLARYDIHAVCGCIKGFLRSLKEPVIGLWSWRDFSRAADISNEEKRRTEMCRIIKDLPSPNQDTLGFIVLHLQRIANAPAVKMPVGNLAKVFGPSLLGYSPECDSATMLKEIKKQQIILETLLTTQAEFWQEFVFRPQEEGRIYSTRASTRASTRQSNAGGTFTRTKAKDFQMTHMASTPQLEVQREAKRIYFTDEPENSPREVYSTRQRKKYFD